MIDRHSIDVDRFIYVFTFLGEDADVVNDVRSFTDGACFRYFLSAGTDVVCWPAGAGDEAAIDACFSECLVIDAACATDFGFGGERGILRDLFGCFRQVFADFLYGSVRYKV